jgi:PAS domain S-box-containing protein
VDEALDGIFIADGESFRILEANPRGCDLLGYSREELLRLHVPEIVDPEDLARHPLEVEGLRSGRPRQTERRLRRRDGTTFHAQIQSSQLADGRLITILRDITARARTEQALRDSEARYRTLLEYASDGIFISDAGTNGFLEANARACEMLGYTRDELLAMRIPDVVHPEDLATHPPDLAILTSGRVGRGQHRLRRKDGAYFVSDISVRRLPDGRVISIVRDVTDRARAEQALRESEERFRRVVESDMLGIVFGLSGGQVQDANDYFLRLVGYTRHDLLAGRLRWNAIMAPESADLRERAIAQSHEAGVVTPFETEFVRKDGTRVPVLVGAALLGRERRLGVGFALDLSQRRLAERRLAESERHLRRAQDLAHVGSWDADLRAGTASFSEEMARILGLPHDAGPLPFKVLLETVHPEDRALVEQRTRRGIERQEPLHGEYRILRPDGAVRILEVTAEPVLDASGRPVRLIGSVQDVTERRFLEHQLREAQKLEAIGRLAGGVAHDFNNLLTVILGFSETQLVELSADDPNRVAAEHIRQAAQRAAALTQQLLAFGRRQVFQLKVFDLNAVVVEMRDILQRLIGERFQVVTSPGARQSFVRADRGQIEQVIMNLALNARDAMPGGGRLSMATRDVEPAGAAPGGPADSSSRPWVLLTVSDTGTGMSADVQTHIFEPFFTTKEVGQGTGLGLATVYGIVTQSGGRIEVTSAPGQGSTFGIHLPCAGAVADVEEVVATVSDARGEETVLLVEDEAVVRGFVAEVLRHRGYRVLEASDGEEAVRTAQGHDGIIHILVTDVVMPGINGHDLARHLEGERPALKTLFVSGYGEGAPGRPEGAGSDGSFLQKPFTPFTIARKVREVLDGPPSGPPGL